MANSEFTTSVNDCVQQANQKAYQGGKKLDTSYVLVELMDYSDGGVTPLLKGIGVDTDKLIVAVRNLQSVAPSLQDKGNSEKFSDGFLQAFSSATDIAKQNNSTVIDMNTLLLAISMGDDQVATLMNSMEANPKKIKMAISDSLSADKRVSGQGHYPTLLEYGRDMTQFARDGLMDPVIGRETETRRVMEILSRRTKNNPVIVGEAGVGKSISDDTLVPVYDPEGKVFYKRHGDLQIGDFVFDRYGNPTQVIGVYPQGEQRVFEVHLKKRGYIECNDEHLWTYRFAKGNDPKYKWNTATLKEIVDKGILVPQKRGRKPAPKYAIPMNGAVQWGEKDFPLDPYVLGAFIGNGYMKSTPLALSSGKPDVPSGIAEVLNAESIKINGDNYYYHFLDQDGKKIKTSDIFVGPSSGLIDSYSHEKFVPEEYKYGSVEQRWSLIQGLFDTDGSINDDGKRFNVTYSTVSKQLVEDIQEVLRGLGIDSSIREYSRDRKYVNGEESRIEYNLHVSVEDEKKALFFKYSQHKLEVARKSVENTKSIQRQYNKVLIENVIDTGKMKPMTCIKVDNEEQLYQVGKQHVVTHNTSVVEGLAQKIVDNDCPEQLKGKTLISLDLAKLNAGASYKGQFEERVRDILEEIKSSDGQVITFIDEIHMIAADSGSPMNLANMMKEYLARGVLKLVGATTLDEFRQYLEKDPALDRRFQKVIVNEPDTEDAIAILRGVKEKYEAHHGIMVSDAALVSCVELSQRYITNRFLPDKAIDLLDEACAKLKISISTAPAIIDELSRKLANLETEKSALFEENTEVARIRIQEINEELTEVREKLSQEKVKWENDQAEVEKVSQIRREIEEEKRNEKKFSAEADWGASAQAKKRIDDLQKELQEVEEEAKSKGVSSRMVAQQVTPEIISEVVSSWTGVPASKMNASETERILSMGDKLRERVVGQDEAIAALVKAVKRSRSGVKDPNKPSSFMFAGSSGAGKSELSKALAEFLYDDERALITFDMSEYADKTSVNKLVGASAGFIGYDSRPALEAVRDAGSAVLLFDEAEKADVTVLLTLLGAIEEGRLTLSNGKEVDFKNTIMIFTTNAGAPKDGIIDKEKAMEEVRHHEKFRPEFLNRLDDIIIFNPLSVDALKDIANIQLKRLERVISHTRLTLELTDSARNRIAYSGYDPAYGGRVVRRIVSNDIADLISDAIIMGEITPGSHIVIDTDAPFVEPEENLNDEQILEYINNTQFPGFVLQIGEEENSSIEDDPTDPDEERKKEENKERGKNLLADINSAISDGSIDPENDDEEDGDLAALFREEESSIVDDEEDEDDILSQLSSIKSSDNSKNSEDKENNRQTRSPFDNKGDHNGREDNDKDNPYSEDGIDLEDLFDD